MQNKRRQWQMPIPITQTESTTRFEAGDTISFIPYHHTLPVTDIIKCIKIEKDDYGDDEMQLFTLKHYCIMGIAGFRFSIRKKMTSLLSPCLIGTRTKQQLLQRPLPVLILQQLLILL
jgi:hypothetical protein